MSDTISVTGTVATDPRHVVTAAGLRITTFRLASSQRRYDRTEGKWVEAPTNWYSVAAFNALAVNAATSLHKGERVVVRGRLQIRDWENENRSGTTVEVVAESIGHDLLWGTTAFTKASGAGARPAAETAPVASDPDQSRSAQHDSDGWALPGADADAPPPTLADVPF